MSSDHTALIIAGAVSVVAIVLGPAVRFWLRRRGRTAIADDLATLRWPVRVTGVALVGRVAAADLEGSPLRAIATVALIATVSWVLLRLLLVGQEVVFRRLRIDAADNLRARSRRTQLALMRRVANVVVVFGAVVVTLMVLTPLAEFGPAIVAYTGLIGVVLGVALRSPLENMAAGVIVAFTEPVRIDDVVVVEGEWGRVEEISLVNVVVRIWDERRLVLPTARFVNEPFENWTRRSAHVTGAVLLSVDFTVDVDDLRLAVERALSGSRLWDGRVSNVQVVDLTERGVQIRVLVSAASAPRLWDLRCELRERLLDHLAQHDDVLPRLRSAHPEDRFEPV